MAHPYCDPADALMALANVVAAGAPTAQLVVGLEGVGAGRGCQCGTGLGGLLRVELQPGTRPSDGSPVSLGDCTRLTANVSVIWMQCVPVIEGNGAAPPALDATAASLAALRNGWVLLRRMRGTPEAAWWRFVDLSPVGDGQCRGVRIDLETDLSVRPDSQAVVS